MPWLPVFDYTIIKSPRLLKTALSNKRSRFFAVLWCDEKWVLGSKDLKFVEPSVTEACMVFADNADRISEWKKNKNSGLLCVVDKREKQSICFVLDGKTIIKAFVF